MRIVIDMQGAQTESRYRGIGRYSRSLALAMAQNRGEHEIILALNGLFPDTVESVRAAFAGILPQENIRVWYAPTPVRACDGRNLWRGKTAQYLRESFLASLRPDVLLVSSLFEGFGDDAVCSIGEFAPEIVTAVVLYDLIPLACSETYLDPNPAYRDFYHGKLQQLKRADAWFSISGSSTDEACTLLQLDRRAITDISAACDAVFKPLEIPDWQRDALLQRFAVTRPFVLYSGGADTRKNLKRLIGAFAHLEPTLRRSHQLVLVGKIGDELAGDFKALARSRGMADDELVFTGSISDQELSQFYNLCQAYIFPSLHKGFGLPVLEAMSCGVPVIAANASCLPEVVGLDEALFDPLDENDIAEKLARVLADPGFRDRLKAHGRAQVGRYSWEQTARKALDALERVAAMATRRPAPSVDTHGLIEAVARAGGDFGEQDLQQCAAAISTNHPLPRPRTVFVDISELVQRDAATGVQRVTRSILGQLLVQPPQGYRVEAVYATTAVPGFRSAKRFTAALLGTTSDESDDPMEATSGDIFLGLDLQHHTTRAQASYLQALRARGVAVHFVIYDLLPIQFPQYWPDLHPVHSEWLHTVAQFDGAVCISRTVASELFDWLESNRPQRLRPFRIGWFHLGADIDNSLPSRGMPDDAGDVLARLAARPTFLVVGTIEPRKGQKLTLAAFEQLWADGRDVNLVLVGKQGWLVEQLVDQLRSHSELGRRLFWLEGISDEYLAKVYASATCLISPSEGEGFGLPLIEAAQLGLPIIATDIPIFREVAGNCATYFSGNDATSLARVVDDWIAQWRSGRIPDVSAMPWLTWEQSAEQLKRVVCAGEWGMQWAPL